MRRRAVPNPHPDPNRLTLTLTLAAIPSPNPNPSPSPSPSPRQVCELGEQRSQLLQLLQLPLDVLQEQVPRGLP